MTLTLTPAYGRDYRSKKELLADWRADKDFLVNLPHGTTYTNRSDLERLHPGETIQARYARLRKVTVLRIGKD